MIGFNLKNGCRLYCISYFQDSKLVPRLSRRPIEQGYTEMYDIMCDAIGCKYSNWYKQNNHIIYSD